MFIAIRRDEQEPAVVGRAVLPARPRRAGVAVTCLDARPPERVDLGAVARAEADVEPAGDRVLAVGHPDVPVLPLDQLGVRIAGLGTQNAQHRAVEALRSREIRDGDRDVVEHPAEPTGRSGPVVTGVTPGARRVERTGANGCEWPPRLDNLGSLARESW